MSPGRTLPSSSIGSSAAPPFKRPRTFDRGASGGLPQRTTTTSSRCPPRLFAPCLLPRRWSPRSPRHRQGDAHGFRGGTVAAFSPLQRTPVLMQHVQKMGFHVAATQRLQPWAIALQQADHGKHILAQGTRDTRPPAWRRYGTVNVKGATIQDKGRHHFMDKVLLFNTA